MNKEKKRLEVSAKLIMFNTKYRLQHQLGAIDAPWDWPCFIYGIE